MINPQGGEFSIGTTGEFSTGIDITEGQYRKGGTQLSCVEIESGREAWSVGVSDPWGWTEVDDDKIYYFTRSGALYVVDAKSGLLQRKLTSFGWPLGYLIPTSSALITGGWRGYSDLRAYDPITLEEIWRVAIKSPDLQSFSVPSILSDEVLLCAHHTQGVIELLNVKNGQLIEKHDLPSDFHCSDLSPSFQIQDGSAVFFSETGRILTIDSNSRLCIVDQLNIKNNRSPLPLFDKTRIVYFDDAGSCCMYDRVSDKTIWKNEIENNLYSHISAAFVGLDSILVGGSLGQVKLFDAHGEQVDNFNSYRRIGTPFLTHGRFVSFGAKSELVVLECSI